MTYFEVLSVHDLLQHLASVGEITKPGKWIYKDLALLAFYRFTCCTKLPQSLLPMFISFFLSFVPLRGIIIAIFRSFGTNHIWSFWDLAPKCVCGPNLITLPFFRLDFFRFYEANVNLKGLPWQGSNAYTLVFTLAFILSDHSHRIRLGFHITVARQCWRCYWHPVSCATI